MQTLLIADCNEDFRLALAEALQTHFRILSCDNGQKALELVRRERPSLLVLELMLPELDGLSLLETLNREAIRPKVLVITSLITDYVLTAAQRLGIEYVIRKPCPIHTAVSRIFDLHQKRQFTRETILQEILLDLGIQKKHDGFTYMTEGTLMRLDNPNLSVTKELYPDIAKRHQKKPGDVERSIRSALEAGFLRGPQALWQFYFPNIRKRPSNSLFLSVIADVIRNQPE